MPPLTPPKSAADLAAYLTDGQLLTARPNLSAIHHPLSTCFTAGTAYTVHTRECHTDTRTHFDPAFAGNLHVAVRVIRVFQLTDDQGETHTFSPAPHLSSPRLSTIHSLADLWLLFTPPPIATIAQTHRPEFERNLNRLFALVAA
jgi:hypothetical protein